MTLVKQVEGSFTHHDIVRGFDGYGECIVHVPKASRLSSYCIFCLHNDVKGYYAISRWDKDVGTVDNYLTLHPDYACIYGSTIGIQSIIETLQNILEAKNFDIISDIIIRSSNEGDYISFDKSTEAMFSTPLPEGWTWTVDKEQGSLSRKQLVDLIYMNLNLTEELSRSFIDEVLDDIILFDKKQHDYGSENIKATGLLGVVVRVNDKIARLRNLLLDNADRSPSNEAVEDSWKDISIYGVIARMLMKGVWK